MSSFPRQRESIDRERAHPRRRSDGPRVTSSRRMPGSGRSALLRRRAPRCAALLDPGVRRDDAVVTRANPVETRWGPCRSCCLPGHRARDADSGRVGERERRDGKFRFRSKRCVRFGPLHGFLTRKSWISGSFSTHPGAPDAAEIPLPGGPVPAPMRVPETGGRTGPDLPGCRDSDLDQTPPLGREAKWSCARQDGRC